MTSIFVETQKIKNLYKKIHRNFSENDSFLFDFLELKKIIYDIEEDKQIWNLGKKFYNVYIKSCNKHVVPDFMMKGKSKEYREKNMGNINLELNISYHIKKPLKEIFSYDFENWHKSRKTIKKFLAYNLKDGLDKKISKLSLSEIILKLYTVVEKKIIKLEKNMAGTARIIFIDKNSEEKKESFKDCQRENKFGWGIFKKNSNSKNNKRRKSQENNKRKLKKIPKSAGLYKTSPSFNNIKNGCEKNKIKKRRSISCINGKMKKNNSAPEQKNYKNNIFKHSPTIINYDKKGKDTKTEKNNTEDINDCSFCILG